MIHELKIVLPWPSTLLNPNARPNRHQKAAAAKAARRDAGFAAVAAIRKQRWPAPVVTAIVQPVFFSPDVGKRSRDVDNFGAMLKPIYDGLADAKVIVNDRGLTPLPARFEKSNDKRLELIVTTEPENKPDEPQVEAQPFPRPVRAKVVLEGTAIGWGQSGGIEVIVFDSPIGGRDTWAADLVELHNEKPAEEDPIAAAVKTLLADEGRLPSFIASATHELIIQNHGKPEATAVSQLAPGHIVAMLRSMPVILELAQQFAKK